MVIITNNAEEILRQLRTDYADTKTAQEYGRTAFWYWYDQILKCMYSLDGEDLPIGKNKTYTMQYWGDIIYSHITALNGTSIYLINDFNFDQENFSSWIRHSKLKVTGFQNTPLSQNTSADGWGVLNKCENGFDVVFKSDERLRNYYNFSYNGKIVYTQNDNRTP